jgi:hypothetical protein
MPTIKRPRNRNAPATGTEVDSIDNLVLQNRAYQGLRSALFNTGVKTDGDMTIAAASAVSDDHIMRNPNTGRKSLRDIRTEIDRYLGR